MIPSIQNYPLFEANQILTNEQLNLLFGYNDEQNRLTRTHLVGVGIVCGLDVITAPDAKSITITRGCGVTSEGYLVIQETDLVYTVSRNYVAPKEVAYPVLQDGAGVNLFPLWELLPQVPPANTDPTVKALDNTGNFLTDKIVMLFVELNKTGNKNCLPNSCDDKGSTITITIRPLLITKTNADKIKTKISNYPDKAALPDIRMPRFDVSKTLLKTTPDVIKAYKIILTKSFIDKAIANLKKLVDTYAFLNINATQLNSLLQSNTIFSYEPDGTIKLTPEYYYQYYYDFVSDLVDTYNEIKDKSGSVMAACCPDPSWFPRHLFLKEVINPPVPSNYRHYFIPSPAVARKGQLTEEIIHLFNRLYMMLLSFPKIAAPTIINGGGVSNSDLRVTPSFLGTNLSGRAIPHYYSQDKLTNNKQLFEYWNYKFTKAGKANQNLSYRAIEYPATEDFVKVPLKYDLEPYNFFRIEGHVGKNYKSVLTYLINLKNSNRLPFDVVAVKTGNKTDTLTGTAFEAHFTDLETSFLLLQALIVCKGGTDPNVLLFKKLEHVSQLGDPVPPSNKTIIELLKTVTSGQIQCEVAELVKLWETYSKRAAAIQQQFLLSNYAEKHVGLQHKAGVPTGGTFVIVYHGEVVTQPAPGGFVPGFIVIHDVMVGGASKKMYKLDAGAASYYNIDEKNVAIYNKLLSTLDPEDPLSVDFINETFQPVVGRTSRGRLRGRGFAGNAGAGFGPLALAGVPVAVTEGIVFADFYLPYQCCADGNPIKYSITENAAPLAAFIEKQECADGQNVVHFVISGGTPPYKANGNDVGIRFDLTFGSNQGGQVTVTDSKGGSVVITVPAKDCKPPCTLPCKGIVNTCRYLPWIQLPERIIYPSKDIVLEMAYLTISDDTGAVIYDEQFVTEVRKIIDATGDIKTSNYHDFMKQVAKLIGDSAKQKTSGAFDMGYEVQDSKVTGQLVIRNFACYPFELRIRMSVNGIIYDYRYTNTGADATLHYTEKQAHFEARLPKFGCRIQDNCLDKIIKEECRNDTLVINRETDIIYFVNGDFKAIYWIVEGGVPGFMTGPELRLNANSALPDKLRVLAIDKNGCWAYAEHIVIVR